MRLQKFKINILFIYSRYLSQFKVSAFSILGGISMSNLTIKKSNPIIKRKENERRRRLIQLFLFTSVLLTTFFVIHTVAFAATIDPVVGINNLKSVFISIVEAIGVIVLIIGVLFLGSSFASHDPTQRITGLTVMAAGLIIAGASFIVDKVYTA